MYLSSSGYVWALIKANKIYFFQWFEEIYEDPDSLSEEISQIKPQTSPMINMEDSVWFEEYTPDQSYDDDLTSSDEMSANPSPLNEDITSHMIQGWTQFGWIG